MRKALAIAAVAALVGPVTLAAQIGLKAGASFGNISNKGVIPDNLKTRTGLAGGLYLESGGVIGMGFEALYAQRGLDEDQAASTQEVKFDYIDVPVYLKVVLPTPGIKPFGYAGPQVSYEVRCKTASGAACTVASDDHSKWDYAAVIGAGVHFDLSSFRLGIEGRYVYGLKDLKPSTVTSAESYKTRSFMILASIGGH